MNEIKVWAPNAETVEIQVNGSSHHMLRCRKGWWSFRSPEVQDGLRYAYIVEGGTPLPDPRSPRQSEGVHGTSQFVDHNLFPWTDRAWQPPPLSSAIIYELHVGTFSAQGTFEGVTAHLDHLLHLGVTHIELMPVNTFSGPRGWGYDGVDLFAPHEAYGGPDGLKRLVDTCHTRGLAVILDVVYNHLGPEGNYLERFGPYFTDRYSSPWGKAVNFDGPDSDEVRRFFCDNALMWLRDYHIDGLRLDAIHAIVDTSALHILEQLAIEVEALEAQIGRHLVLIAESDLNDPRIINPRAVGGYGMDSQWSDDFHHTLHTVLTGERNGYYSDFGTLADIAAALSRGFVYMGQRSGYRNRVHGRAPVGLSGHKFIGYLQNHDQVGNRARGDRMSQLVTAGRLKIGAALVFTSPFIPMIFQGEEWGASTPFQYFTSHQDQALGEAVRTGRKSEFAAFGWDPDDIPDPQASETFERSKLQWNELSEEPHSSLYDWYRQLIRLRRRTPALTDDRLDKVLVTFSEEAKWLVMRRGPVTVAVNLAEYAQVLADEAFREASLLLASQAAIGLQPDGLHLPSDSVAILSAG